MAQAAAIRRRPTEGLRQETRAALRARSAALGLSLAFYIPLGGELYVGEILLIGMLPMLASSASGKEAQLLPSRYWALGLLSLGALGVAEALSPAPAWKAPLGLAVLLLAAPALLMLFARDFIALEPLLVGLSFGTLLAVHLQPGFYTATYPWKFGYAVPSFFLVTATCARWPRKAVPVLLLFAAINILFDYKSYALISGLAAAFLILGRISARGVQYYVAVLAACFAAILFMQLVFAPLAASGTLGAAAQNREQLQGGGSLGLLGGRPEILFSARALAERPILGYGTNGQSLPAFVAAGREQLAALGYARQVEGYRSDQLPVHSYIMQATLAGGVVAAPFWVWLLIVAVRVVRPAVAGPRRGLQVVTVVLATSLVWNSLFSPFGGFQRVLVALALSVIFTLRGNWEEGRP